MFFKQPSSIVKQLFFKQVKIHNNLPDIAILQNSFDTLNPKTGLAYLFLFQNNSNTSLHIVYML